MERPGWFAAGVRRLRNSALPVLQCGIAAGAAWFVASELFGHAQPFFAPIAAVISLGVSLANRVRRAVELVLGVSLGVLVGDLLIAGIGSGWWQIGLVVTLAVGVAVFLGGGVLLINQAGASAVLVATLVPPGQLGGLDRCLDALIGGVVGVLVVAALPSNPLAPLRRDSRALLDELAAVLSGVAGGLRDRDADAAHRALLRARSAQPMIDAVRTDLRGGREVTVVSPFHRRRRPVLAEYDELTRRADYAMRNARVVARRAYSALLDGEPAVPELADVLTELATAVERLAAELHRDGDPARARPAVVGVARHAKVVATDDPLGTSERVLVEQVRSMTLDLLQATGMTRAEAVRAMTV